MVRIDRKVHEKLCNAKIIPREPLSDCINRLIDENAALKKERVTKENPLTD
jgi:hypothetical protein